MAVDVDPDLARRLLVEGGTLIFLDVPPGTEFGIDLKSWNTGEKFKGVKMIPPGLHYVYYSPVDKFGESAPRVGFVHNFKKSEFLVKKWDKDAEDLSMTEVGEDEKERLEHNLFNLDKFLGPYPFDVWSKWRTLTSRVTETLLARVLPESGRIRAALELVPGPPRDTSCHRRRTLEEREEDLLPSLKPCPGTELRFTHLPDRSYPEGASPAEITLHSLDASYSLERVLDQLESATELIGELQFSFVCFLVGHSLEAFEHWKQLVQLLCACDRAILAHCEMYCDFLMVLEAQLEHIPEDFLVDIVASNNVIYHSLCTLFRTLHEEEQVEARLKTRACRLADKLTVRFGWDFSQVAAELGDEAPVVVET